MSKGSGEQEQNIQPQQMCLSMFHWIGLREKLQDTLIVHGKNNGFR